MIATGSAGRPCCSTSARTDGCRHTRFPMRRSAPLLDVFILGRPPDDVVEESPVFWSIARLKLSESARDALWDWFAKPFLRFQELFKPRRQRVRYVCGPGPHRRLTEKLRHGCPQSIRYLHQHSEGWVRILAVLK